MVVALRPSIAFSCAFRGIRQRRPVFFRRSIIRSRTASTSSGSAPSRFRRFFYGSLASAFIVAGYVYVTDTRASVHRYLVPGVIRFLYADAEDAHRAGVSALKELYTWNLHPRERGNRGVEGPLAITVFGYVVENPVGISGGLDKYGELLDPLFAIGPGVVEIGGVTPLPQDGNPTPRVFRIPSEEALINRYGLPSEGADVMAMRLRDRVLKFAHASNFGVGDASVNRVLDGEAGVPPGSLTEGRLLAVQIAKNKATPEGDLQAVVDDHVYCVEKIGKYADIIVVNVSSPNTPGLRTLQSKAPLTRILSEVVAAAGKVDRKRKPVVMVKVSPDEDSPSQVAGICDAVWLAGVNGVIVANTTRSRPSPAHAGAAMSASEAGTMLEEGGYSSPQLFEPMLRLVRLYRTTLDEGALGDASPRETQGANGASRLKDDINKIRSSQDESVTLEPAHPSKVIFASGGITNGEQAAQALAAGASVAMVYTAMVYGGVGTISRIKDELTVKHREG
jgi:dihydroorotate dehydrogenase